MARYDMDANVILYSIIGGFFLVGDGVGGGYGFFKKVLLLQNIENHQSDDCYESSPPVCKLEYWTQGTLSYLKYFYCYFRSIWFKVRKKKKNIYKDKYMYI